MRNKRTAKQLQAACDKFNAVHEVGTEISVWRDGIGGDARIVTITITEPGAYVMDGHTAVVQVAGDCVALRHVIKKETLAALPGGIGQK
jgi:hypothetical protein